MEPVTRKFYRIIGIEYTDDGCCHLEVQLPGDKARLTFTLSAHCHRLKWLSHFQQPDVETVWQLVRRQRNISGMKKIFCYLLVKFSALKLLLNSWESEAKAVLGPGDDEFDEW